MPRRPLFCQTCDDLLDRFTKAANAAAVGCGGPETGIEVCPATLQMRAELRNRYLELKEQVLQHREIAHRYCRNSR